MDNPAPHATERAPSGDGSQGPRVTRDQVKNLGRLRRSMTDRHVGGVAGGLARHLDVDPILVRVAFVVAVFLGGAGILAYVAAWILVPEEGTADQPLGLDERNRTVALTGVGVLAALAALADWVDAYWFPWPVALVALGVMWLVSRNRSGTPYGEEAPDDGAVPASYDVGNRADGLGVRPGYARPSRPRNPRKRGPILLWFTLALIALAEGVLAVTDVAGVLVTPSAYPALALAITAAMLLVGAFWGRAGGLILVGAVAALATGVTTAVSTWEEEVVRSAPTEARDLAEEYDLSQGELVLDLSGIDDVDGLDGRTVRIHGGAGRIEVVAPDDVDVRVTTDVAGGEATVFGQRSDGFGVTQEGFLDGGGTETPDLAIVIDLGVGEVVVRDS